MSEKRARIIDPTTVTVLGVSAALLGVGLLGGNEIRKEIKAGNAYDARVTAIALSEQDAANKVAASDDPSLSGIRHETATAASEVQAQQKLRKAQVANFAATAKLIKDIRNGKLPQFTTETYTIDGTNTTEVVDKKSGGSFAEIDTTTDPKTGIKTTTSSVTVPTGAVNEVRFVPAYPDEAAAISNFPDDSEYNTTADLTRYTEGAQQVLEDASHGKYTDPIVPAGSM